MRPQVNGPIDVGYGNYILTAPADRQGRRRRKKKKSKEGADNEVEEADKEEEDDNIKERDSNMRREKKLVTRKGKTMENGKYDVSELLSISNTLTNPNNTKHINNKKSEL